jgi:phage baseplate assembly protein V
MSPQLGEVLDAGREPDHRIAGVVTAMVHDVADPEGLGRVMLLLDWVAEDFVLTWARVAFMGASGGSGAFWVPAVGDEVLVAFEHGDPRLPYVLGGLYSSGSKPAATTTDQRSLTTPSGHVIVLDDTDGDAKIEIVDQTGDNRIVITSSDNGIAISAEGDVTIESASGRVSISGTDVEIEATNSLTLSSGGSLDLEATGDASLQGQTVAIN